MNNDINTLSYDELLEKYKELKDKMDHTKAVAIPTKKVNAGATAIAFFILWVAVPIFELIALILDLGIKEHLLLKHEAKEAF